jgi:hypothetical protein
VGARSPDLHKTLDRLDDQLEKFFDGLASLDPEGRFVAVTSLLERLSPHLQHGTQIRGDALAMLRKSGWSYDLISERTGLSKARIAQLVRASLAK